MTSRQWKHHPFVDPVPLPYGATFDRAEFEKIRAGLVPGAMEDKWFIQFEEPDLGLYRSWTGKAVYRVTFERLDNAHRVVAALREASIMPDYNDAYHAELLNFLIRNLLLGEFLPFPRPSRLEEPVPGVFQHSICGRRYPEKAVEERNG